MSLDKSWEIVIGLEIHAQISSKSKLFSRSGTKFGADPNSQVSLIDAAMPGMLPTLNEFCIRQAVKTGLGLNAKINRYSVFDRKNYFYPDLPQGYQISQFYYPLVQSGWIIVRGKKIRINRVHVEQDAGKSLHDQSPNSTYIDLNRAGIGLMEIVTEPDMSSAEEAGEYMKQIRSILRYLGTCDGDMEKGSLRCDANVSVRKTGDKLGTRCEIKNLNSIKNVVKAIEYEAVRQVEVIESGGVINQETRLFDANTGETRLMRSKEDAMDYRYFHDPDLLPLILDEDFIEQVKKELPELPDQKRKRYQSSWNLSDYDVEILINDREVSDYFEEVAKNCDPKIAANWISGELFAKLNKANIELSSAKISPEALASLINMISDNVISGKMAKIIFEDMFETGKDPKIIIKEKNLIQVSDSSSIEKLIDEILAENPDKVTEYKSGKDKLFGFFVGQAMKKSEGKANPQMINDILIGKLK